MSSLNQSSNANPSESLTFVSRKRRRSASGSSKSKSSLQSHSDTNLDRKRSQSESSITQKQRVYAHSDLSISGQKSSVSSFVTESSTSGQEVETTSCFGALKAVTSKGIAKIASKKRRKSGSKASASSHSSLFGEDFSIQVNQSSSKSSVSSVKSRKGSGSSVTSLGSSESLLGNCEKCRQGKKQSRKKSGDSKSVSTRTWTVTEVQASDSNKSLPKSPVSATSTLVSSPKSSLDSPIPIKRCLRASTQAQSRAEAGTYRVSRKRTSLAKAANSETPPLKTVKVEGDSGVKSEKKSEQEKSHTSVIKQESSKNSVLSISQPGPSNSKQEKVSKKKAKLEKKSKKDKLLKAELSKLSVDSSTSKTSPPGLNSLRRQTRAKKTGSCASSR